MRFALPSRARSSMLAAWIGSLSPMVSWAHGISDVDRQRMLAGGYLQYVELGARHMLTGYDHLLFLLGVVFMLRHFVDVVRLVTVFTLGHCITLVGATLLHITWNYYLVDAFIAISVIYKGFDNNGGVQKHLNLPPPPVLWVVFGFGLLHGFGLSTRLQQLPLGEDSVSIVGRILSFNLGVELGQIMALTAMVGLLALWRHRPSFERFSHLANLGLVLAGIYLLFVQLHGLQHDLYADSFRFPEAEHRHLHEDMEVENAIDASRNSL